MINQSKTYSLSIISQFSTLELIRVMGNNLGGLLGGGNSGNNGQGAYGYGPELQCCDAVVDPVSLLSAIGAIAAVSLFLRQGVIDNMIMMGRRKRKRSLLDIVHKTFPRGILYVHLFS